MSLDDVLRPVALEHRRRVLTADPSHPFLFLSGYRPTGYQKVLFEHPELHPGTPAAAPGHSKHERRAAYDAEAGTAMQRLSFAQEAEALGLIWGGRFSAPDYNHCELPFTNDQLDAYNAVRSFQHG